MKKQRLTYGELKKMYPIGTKFRSAYSGNIFTVDSYDTNFFNNNKDSDIIDDHKVSVRSRNDIPFIYYSGKLSEILSLPQPIEKIENQYEIY